jgi:hypothetical protein
MLKFLKVKNKKLKTIITIIVLGLILLIGSGYIWWHSIYTSPRRVFEGMLDSSLRTSAVTKRVTQSSGNQKLDQTTQLQLGSQNLVHSFTTLSQGSEPPTIVKTESIGTAKEDYVRYTGIETQQKSSSGGPLDFTHIINVWGKSSASDPQSSAGQLFSDTVFGVIPFAGLDGHDRADLLKFIHDNQVYKPDYNSVKRTKDNGRSVYIYDTEVKAETYIELLKKFGHLLGFNQYENLDSAAYKNAAPIHFKLSVDVLSRQLVKVEYTGGDRQETYGGYGLIAKIDLPTKTIAVEELQQRLQSVR